MTTADTDAEIHLHDFVYVGDSRDLTWEVVYVSDPSATAFGPIYHLESGQTGRRRYETASKLTVYRRAE